MELLIPFFRASGRKRPQSTRVDEPTLLCNQVASSTSPDDR
jgi:hypothetical protein